MVTVDEEEEDREEYAQEDEDDNDRSYPPEYDLIDWDNYMS